MKTQLEIPFLGEQNSLSFKEELTAVLEKYCYKSIIASDDRIVNWHGKELTNIELYEHYKRGLLSYSEYLTISYQW